MCACARADVVHVAGEVDARIIALNAEDEVGGHAASFERADYFVKSKYLAAGTFPAGPDPSRCGANEPGFGVLAVTGPRGARVRIEGPG